MHFIKGGRLIVKYGGIHCPLGEEFFGVYDWVLFFKMKGSLAF